MAKITVERGRVARVFQDGKALTLEETQTRGSNEFQVYYTVWFGSKHGLKENDRPTISGVCYHKLGEWTDGQGQVRQKAEVHINAPKILEDKEPEMIPVDSPLDILDHAPF